MRVRITRLIKRPLLATLFDSDCAPSRTRTQTDPVTRIPRPGQPGSSFFKFLARYPPLTGTDLNAARAILSVWRAWWIHLRWMWTHMGHRWKTPSAQKEPSHAKYCMWARGKQQRVEKYLSWYPCYRTSAGKAYFSNRYTLTMSLPTINTYYYHYLLLIPITTHYRPE